MTEELAQFLMTSRGRDLIAYAENLRLARADTLTALTRLRRQALPEQAAAAWEMADLRWRGVAKFGAAAGQMYFTREAMEQASGARAAAYHARRFADAGLTQVADLCGGIGGDALAFARQAIRVTLYENDPARALFARENARVHGLGEQITVVNADTTTAAIASSGTAWFDPARRRDTHRVAGPEDYTPPLSFLDALRARGVSHIGTKVSPAVDHSLAAHYGAELEFVSDGGECKEALLWQGALTTGAPLQATLLGADGPRSLRGAPDEAMTSSVGDGPYLYEPDPAVIRAHLVQTVGAQIGAAPVHPAIAYLLGGERIETPWATGYEVLEEFPYSRRQLQKALTARGIGRVIIKKRGFPQEPEEVRRGLKLTGDAEMIVILTRRSDTHHAFLCSRLPPRTNDAGGETGRSSSR